MKAVKLEILKLVETQPGLSLNRIGTSLSRKWCSSYIRTVTTELLHHGYLENINDTGRCAFKLHITDAGRTAISGWQAVNE